MSVKLPNFKKINESFLCTNCGFDVPKSEKTCRDHCPKCLYSLHVDDNPGDRNAGCGGLLKPQSYSQSAAKGIVIHYVCQSCGKKKSNKFLQHDKLCPDDFDALLKIIPDLNSL